MDKTSVLVYFSIYSDEFDLNEVTHLMELTPTRVREKGIIPEGRKIPSVETSWTLSTEYEHSYDINVQLNKIINLLKGKEKALKTIKDKFDVNFNFEIVIKIENKETPGIFFEKDTLNFINNIGATIDIDTYVYS